MTVYLSRDRSRVWWLTHKLIVDKSFYLSSPQLWSLIYSNSLIFGTDSTYYWALVQPTPFGVGLIADWLSDYGEGLVIESADFAPPPTVAEVIAALRQKYAELSGLAEQAHPTPN
jgi:hypothetical protein